MRLIAKRIAACVFLILALPLAAAAGFGQFTGGFRFASQLVALGPGIAGDYLRRGFYRLTLKRFSFENAIGFGSLFTHREAEVAERANIGEYCVLGYVNIGKRALIGPRVHI